MNTSPLTKLASHEVRLVANINAAADRLDAVGAADLGAALERLQASADSARERLTVAFSKVNSIAGDVLDNLDDMAGVLAEALAVPPVEPVKVQAVAPAALPAPTVAPPAAKVEPESADQTMARVLLSREQRQQAEPAICAAAPVQPAIESNATVQAPAPALPASTCPKCGFAPRRGESVCRTCNVSVGDRQATVPTIAPPAIDMNQPMAEVLAAIVASHPSDCTRTVTAQDLANGTVFSPDGAQQARSKRRGRKPTSNGTAAPE